MKPSFAFFAALLPAWCLGTGALSASAGTFKRIEIDGNFTDWAGVPVTYSDASEEGAGAGTDFKDVWIAHDADYVYVRVSLYNTGTWLRSQNNVFVNGDGDSTTGFATHATGSEMLIQNGAGYQEKNGTFNDGSLIQDLGWAVAPTAVADEFEFRISRNAKYEDGGSVFTSESIALLLETENANFGEVDVAKDDGPIEYTLDAAPPRATGEFTLLSLTASDWRFNRSGTALDPSWKEITFDDSQAGWESGRALFGKTPTPAAYPVPIVTPFTDANVTRYFRAQFTWDKDPTGLSIIVSNFLSGGAIFYLNGVEVGRVRLPDTNVTFTTPARGPNPNIGSAEILDLPPNALVVGPNVLAAEVHQSADPAELVFGLSLWATDQLPAAIRLPIAPQHLVIEEGAPVTLSVTARGSEPITYQWFKGSTPIADATNATYTISLLTPADAGEYLAKVSNAKAQNIPSPIFTIESRPVPVSFTNASLPADLSVTEGNPASFSVAVAGSQPIGFQWFKDGVAIAGATNQTYEIPVALPANAGKYTCVVSNRVTEPMTSRSATLTVSSDTAAPSLVSASGGGRRILLQFSETLDPASLAPGKFVVTPTVTVFGATLDTNDASRVVLDTGLLSLSTQYTVSVSDVLDRFGNSIGPAAQKTFRATIQVDGDFSDWEGVTAAHSDPEDAGVDTGTHADFRDIWIASDGQYIYLRFTLWRAGDPFIFYNNIFVDADNDLATGYAFSGLGSELLLQGGGGYEQKTGVFNDGGVENLDWLSAANAASTDFELRFSRSARYADADAGGLVFRGDTIALVLESENTGFVAQDVAPDTGSGGIALTLAPVETTELGSLAVAKQGGNISISWSGPGRLQSADVLATAAWQDVPNANTPYSAPISGIQRYYRLVSP